MTPTRLMAGLCAGFVLALATGSFARAEDYPARPITIIVPYKSGGHRNPDPHGLRTSSRSGWASRSSLRTSRAPAP